MIKKEKINNLDKTLTLAIDEYNNEYTKLSELGKSLFYERIRSIDLINNVEVLVNSIANMPKSFETEICEIKVCRSKFTDACSYAKKELDAAKKSAMGVGSGIAAGTAISCLAPSAAMWVATTFGTASTGAAISTLSGAAAQSAAIAWLGGGALTAGGGGMALGKSILVLAGPVGWGIAGATLLTSIVVFVDKKTKNTNAKMDEIKNVRKNSILLTETFDKVNRMYDLTSKLREELNNQYHNALGLFEKDFCNFTTDQQKLLGTLVNNTKSLAESLRETI